MPPIHAVFFDIGDTLVFDDPPLSERFAMALRGLGLPVDAERFPQAFRMGERHALTHYLQGIPWDEAELMRECAACIVQALGLPPLPPPQWRDLLTAFAGVPYLRRVHPEAVALLREMRRRGFVLGAISDWEETLPEVLAELALAPHFDALSVSSLVGTTKPGRAIFHDALRQTGAMPCTSLHVGDWYELDVAGARAVGMQVLLFDHACRAPQADCPRTETFAQMRDYLLALPLP